jgi:hypothetical protein
MSRMTNSMAKNMLQTSSVLVRIGCGAVIASFSSLDSDRFIETSYGMRHRGLVSSTKLVIDMAKKTIDIQK